MNDFHHSPIGGETRNRRGNMVAAIALLIGWAVVAANTQVQQVNQLAHENAPLAAEYLVWLTKIVAFGFSLAVLTLGAWIIWIGHRACRANQFPPPGIKVLRNKHVYVDRKAHFIGWASQFIGVLILIFGTMATWLFVQVAEVLLRH